jgi:hypothetical protein
MADLAVAPAASHPPPPPATDLFGEPIEAHPPWFKPDSFLRPDFDPDAYVAELRSYVPLESLAAELRSHLAALRAELVGLINRDYADFVGLSARLKGVDAAAARMRAPLADLRDKVAGFRAGASAALAALRAGLDQRAAATAARELLELLLDTSHVVSKVRCLKMLLVSFLYSPLLLFFSQAFGRSELYRYNKYKVCLKFQFEMFRVLLNDHDNLVSYYLSYYSR